jgi:hypothetical protein
MQTKQKKILHIALVFNLKFQQRNKTNIILLSHNYAL